MDAINVMNGENKRNLRSEGHFPSSVELVQLHKCALCSNEWTNINIEYFLVHILKGWSEWDLNPNQCSDARD